MASKQDFQPLLDASQNQLGLVFSASDTLDSKNLALLALNAAILIFAAQETFSVHVGWIIVFVSLFLVSILANVAAIWPQNYIGANVDVEDFEGYLRLSHQKLSLQLLADTEYAIEYNTSLNNKKLQLCTLSLLLSAAGTIILLSCILRS